MNSSPLERQRTLRQSGGFFPLPTKARIQVTGEDRLRYLNGQLTIDVPKLAAGSARSTLLLTAKGKLCAPLWVWKEPEALVIEVEESLREETMTRLERYIISDDVSLTDLEIPSQVFHVFGAAAAEPSLKIHRLGIPGYDTTMVPTGLLLATDLEIDQLRIEHGLPTWGFELDAQTLPQEARLEITSVDFDKGCYVGQETVSRLKSVGRVNRRLFGFVGHVEPAAEQRLSLHLPDKMEQVAGELTSRCLDFELAQTIALGYLNREFEDSGTFVAANADGKVLGKFSKRPILS